MTTFQLRSRHAQTRAQQILGSRRTALIAYAVIAALLGYVVNRAMSPGALTHDSFHQLAQAEGRIGYDDWHPVIMSAAWRLLIQATGDYGTLATVQIVFATVCAWLTCWYLYDRSAGFRIGLLGLFLLSAPHAANLIGVIWKDTQMGLTYYAGAVLLLIASRRSRSAWVWGLASIPFFVYGTLVRKNAVVALVPLLIWLSIILFQNARVRGWVRRRVLRAAACTVAVFGLFSGLLLGGGAAVDAATKPDHSSQFTQIMLDDLVFAVPQSAIDSSSAPQDLKDKIRNARQICSDKGVVWDVYWACWGTGANGHFTEIAEKEEVIALWKETLPQYLPRYIDYRAETFARFLFTSKLQFPGISGEGREHGVEWGSPRLHQAMHYYVVDFGVTQLPWLYHAWFWLAGSTLIGLALIRRWRSHIAELSLAASAWIYLMSYIPVVPAQDYRYSYWPALAVTLTALVLLARNWRGNLQRFSLHS